MSQTIRMNCVKVIVQPDLTISYKLTFPLKQHHKHLFDSERVKALIVKNKVRYYYVLESNDRVEILRHMVSCQSAVTEVKIGELIGRQSFLLNKLSNL